jgi:hypothetical protein
MRLVNGGYKIIKLFLYLARHILDLMLHRIRC